MPALSKKTVKILGMCGSLRYDSHNSKLLKFSLERQSSRVKHCDHFIANLNLPLFNEDIENSKGIPPEVYKLAQNIKDSHAIFISTPEYNKNLSGVLKNALDWTSRVKPQPWKGKPIIILSAASGQSGGERAQYSLRQCLIPFDPVLFFAPEITVPDASNAFDEDNVPKSKIIIEKIDRQLLNLEPYLV